jgi:hypothetical protein
MRRASFLIIFLLLWPALYAFAAEERLYIGVWQKGTGASRITPPMLWPEFLKTGETLTKQGLRLHDVESFNTPAGRRYVGVWASGTGANLIVKPLNRSDFEQRRTKMRADGLLLVDLEVFRDASGKPKFLGVWSSGTGAEVVNGPLPFDKFVEAGNALIKGGLRLDDVEVVGAGSNRLYYGLWHHGEGANLIVSPLRPIEFSKKMKEFDAKGLRLEDLEVLREGKSTFYVCVWKDGPAENRIRNLLTFPQLLSFNNDMVKDGLRLADLETFIAGVPDKPTPPDGGSHPDGGGISFKVPDHVTFGTALRLVVDFSTATDDPPRITMPDPNSAQNASLYPDLPRDHEGNVIFPDNFCGIRITQPDRFVFNKNGSEVDSFPFNNIPECCSLNPNSPGTDCSKNPQNCTVIPKACGDHPQFCSVRKVFGETIYLSGIQFSGPIGECQGSNTGWQFFSPFTQTEPSAPADQQVTLTIELDPDSKIEFFNAQLFNTEAALASYELFTDDTEEKFMEARDRLEEGIKLLEKIDEGWCSIVTFVEKSCEEAALKDEPPNFCSKLSEDLNLNAACE